MLNHERLLQLGFTFDERFGRKRYDKDDFLLFESTVNPGFYYFYGMNANRGQPIPEFNDEETLRMHYKNKIGKDL